MLPIRAIFFVEFWERRCELRFYKFCWLFQLTVQVAAEEAWWASCLRFDWPNQTLLRFLFRFHLFLIAESRKLREAILRWRVVEDWDTWYCVGGSGCCDVVVWHWRSKKHTLWRILRCFGVKLCWLRRAGPGWASSPVFVILIGVENLYRCKLEFRRQQSSCACGVAVRGQFPRNGSDFEATLLCPPRSPHCGSCGGQEGSLWGIYAICVGDARLQNPSLTLDWTSDCTKLCTKPEILADRIPFYPTYARSSKD